MPEAVIVDAVRTPIGRAFKGSLAGLRPDETGAYVLDALLERNPDVAPESVEEVVAGCGLPQGLQAFNIGRIMVLLSEKLPDSVNGVTVSRYCASSLEAIRQAANAVRAGEGDTYIAGRRRMGQPLQRAPGGGRRLRPEREAPGQERAARRLHRDGPDRGERGRQVGGEPRGHGQVRAALTGAGGAVAGVGLLRPRDRAREAGGRRRGRAGRRPARRLDAREAFPAQAGVPGGRQGHGGQLLPTQRRCRSSARDVGHPGEGTGPHAHGRGSWLPPPQRSSRSSWAWRRSARSRRSSSGRA